jgi:outer membrane receptor protein involved in Fe transport
MKMTTLHRAFGLAALLVVSAFALSAEPLSGIVLDERNGEPIRGAKIGVIAHGAEATSDISGNFALDVPAGNWRVRIERAGFAPQMLDVAVAVTEGANLGIVMAPAAEGAVVSPGEPTDTRPAPTAADDPADSPDVDSTPDQPTAFAQSVTVTARAARGSEDALLIERKQAQQIHDSIGRQEIAASAASTGASAMQRVTGVQVVDDKYVYVRGLGERYSNTTINGSIIPSTEPEKRVVPLDLFSANLLNKVSVTKSYTPDKAGEFAAGLVELETLDFPSKASLSLTVGSTYYAGTTGNEIPMFGDGLDLLGNGGLGMPSAIPAERVVKRGPYGTEGFTAEELEVIGESFESGWAPRRTRATTLPSASLTWGETIGNFGLVVSATHNAAFDYREEVQTYYSLGEGDAIKQSHSYEMETGEEEIRQGVVGNVSWSVSPNNQLKLQSFFSQVGRAQGRVFEGFNVDAYNDLRDHRMRHQKESILTAKLSGDHFLPAIGIGSGSLLEWRVASSKGENAENLRQVQYDEISTGVYKLADEPQSGLLLFNDLADTVGDAALDYSIFYSTPRVTGSVKIGGSTVERDRAFGSRRFRYIPNPRAQIDYTNPAEELFTPENIGPGAAFEIREETRVTDTYDATHDVTAAYLMADATWGKWRVVAGARVEDSVQEVVTFNLFDRSAAPMISLNDEQSVLPALNVTYSLTPATNLRAAYSTTVNRPEFRELAPFEFSDVRGGRATVGNPDLVTAAIESFDLRWEWFPRADEVLAASLFLKRIDDPIEQIIRPTAQLSTTYANAASADNFGVELEFRRGLAFLSPRLAEWSLMSNYTWVDSSVDLASIQQSELTTLDRPLVGQAEHIFNLTGEYAPARLGAVVRLLYNYTGEKITDVGALGLPDIYQNARNTVDVVWLQDLGRWTPRLRMKVSAENLLDEERVQTIGGFVHNAYTSGRELGLSLSYNVF